MLPFSVKVGCDLLMVVPDWNHGKSPGLAFHAMEFDQWFFYFGYLWRVGDWNPLDGILYLFPRRF